MSRYLFLAICTVAIASPLLAQARSWDPGRVYATRASLDSLRDRFDRSAASPAYSGATRDRARRLAQQIQERLEAGDYQPGDRILLSVVQESGLTDTFTVAEGPLVELPSVGKVDLRGVLRSELEGHLGGEIGRYVINPEVTARTLIRISVVGEVGAPGFYALPSELLLTDVLVRAGQVTREADLRQITVERGARTVWQAEALGPELIEGRTLDQLNVRAGDRIVVGRKPPSLGAMEGGFRTLAMILAIPASIVALGALVF